MVLNTLCVFPALSSQSASVRASILKAITMAGRGQPKINSVTTSVTTFRSLFNLYSGVLCV